VTGDVYPPARKSALIVIPAFASPNSGTIT
jgi:hypothetical protein